MWTIEFSHEANNYAIDSHPYNEDVLIAIEELAFTEDGLPHKGVYRILNGRYVWDIAEHTVIYRQIDDRLYIILIKPYP